jgi:hypothetical protein
MVSLRSQNEAYLNYGYDKASDISKLAHVDCEVLELIFLGLFEHQLGALADGVDAAQVAGRVESWIWGLWQRDVWEAGRPGAVWSGSRGAQGAIGAVWLAAVGGNLGLGALAIEETHWRQRRQRARFAGERSLGGEVCWEVGRHVQVGRGCSRMRRSFCPEARACWQCGTVTGRSLDK